MPRRIKEKRKVKLTPPDKTCSLLRIDGAVVKQCLNGLSLKSLAVVEYDMPIDNIKNDVT